LKNGDLGSRGYGSAQSSCVADVLVADEHVDVLPDLPLLVRNTISKTGMERPQDLERSRHGSRRASDLHLFASAGK